MVQSYWLIGYRIVEQEQNGEKRAGYGEKLIENLSRELDRNRRFLEEKYNTKKLAQ